VFVGECDGAAVGLNDGVAVGALVVGVSVGDSVVGARVSVYPKKKVSMHPDIENALPKELLLEREPS
jgi:hypothetical protein